MFTMTTKENPTMKQLILSLTLLLLLIGCTAAQDEPQAFPQAFPPDVAAEIQK